jgi:hypothetical protein
LIEFILVFPMMVLLVTGLFFTVLAGLRQIYLGHEAARWARATSMSGSAPADAVLKIRSLPLTPSSHSHQTPRRLDILTLELTRPISFFGWSRTLTARAHEVRVSAGKTR